MRGHEEILAMRRAGDKPACVWLQDWVGDPLDYMVTVGGDVPELLDLRFLINLLVTVESDDRPRLIRLLEATRTAQAGRTVGVLAQRTRLGRYEILEIIDSEGYLTWLK
jgi:hypothetical protein